MEEKKKAVPEGEASLPVQELPADIPAEVRQKLAEDLNEEATEDLKQDIREAEKEEANDEEVKADPEMLTKSRLLKLLVKKQYVKLREVTEEEQPADLAELLEELDENNRLVVFRLLKKEVATEAFAYMSDEARDDLVNAFSDVELVSAIEEMSLDDAADLLEDMPAGVVKRVLEKSSKQTRESLNKLLNYPEKLRRQPDDAGICPPAQGYDRERRLWSHPHPGRERRDRLHLLCRRAEPSAGRCVCPQPAAGRTQNPGDRDHGRQRGHGESHG